MRNNNTDYLTLFRHCAETCRILVCNKTYTSNKAMKQMSDNNYVVYLRVSTSKQGESGLGLESQKAACKALTSDGTVLAEFVEVESGKRSDRPQLAAAIDRARRAKAVLVVAKLDRLARNVAFVSSLMESGVEFVAADNPTASRLTIHILASVAEEEARLISVRTKAALAAAKARGVKLGNPKLTNADRKRGAVAGAAVMRDKAKRAAAQIIGILLELKAEGKSLRAIAKHINESGYRTQRGNLYSAVAVQRILARA